MKYNVFLIRHAQSQANIDSSILQTISNQKVALTNTGLNQVEQTANFLLNYNNYNNSNAIVWHSPYKRTRDTANKIYETLKINNVFANIEIKENILISERQLGLIEFSQNYKEKYKEELKFYNMNKNYGDDFFIKPPLGESPFELSLRVNSFLNEKIKNNNKVHIIVSHGAAIKAINIMYRDLAYEKYSIDNPFNASVIDLVNNYTEIFCPNPKTR